MPRHALPAAAALLLAATAVFAQSTSPVVLTFSTVGDSRQDPQGYDQVSVGPQLSGQDAIWLQNTKAFARILRTIQAQKANMLFFNGDMIHAYGWAAYGYTSLPDSSKINGVSGASAVPTPIAPATTADIVGSDLMATYRQYAYWRGMVSTVMETGTYVWPVPGNHETQVKALGKKAKVENEQAWAANMGDLIFDTARYQALLGLPISNATLGPVGSTSTPTADGLTTDQSKLSYSFDHKVGTSIFHFAVVNTDAVGADGKAPAAWLANDLLNAKARGATKFFVFGHKPAFTYDYKSDGVTTAAAGLDATSVTARNAFWDVITAYQAIYFCGHEHIYNISQWQKDVNSPTAYQVLVGAGGSPFDDKLSALQGHTSTRPATDRSYSWATVKVHADGSVDLYGFGFDEKFGPTTMFDHIYIP